jgi:glycolate oxidase FAD binding subunit
MTAPATAALARLGEITGREHFITDSPALAGYEVDGTRPAAAVRPGSAEEVAEIVRFAAAEKLALIACGARTKLGIGAPPARYDVAVDLSRLDRVIAYDPGDLTLGVEPGIGVAKLSAVLAEQGQFLPLAVPYTNRATLGGTLASGVDSPLRQCYGTARDFVLGMEFVTGEGASAKSGGRVVKSVAGYDLHKLMLGALGTLGILTRINFKTFPLPAASRGFLAAFGSLAGALELRRRIVSSPLQPLTLDILSPSLAELFARATPAPPEPQLFARGGAGADETLPLPGPWFPTSDWLLAAGFGGSEKVLQRSADDLARYAAEAGAKSTLVLDDEDRPKVWGRLREAIPLLLEASPAATILKLSLPPANLGPVSEAAAAIAARAGLPCAQLLRGCGVFYLALLPAKAGAGVTASLAAACAEAGKAAEQFGGSATIPWCPRELKPSVSLWWPVRGDLALMKKVKAVMDPHNILAPGRFLGGI